MLTFEDCRKKWPKTFDRINECVEEENVGYMDLNDGEQRLIIGNLIVDDKDTDLSDLDLREWLDTLLYTPNLNSAQTVVNKIYQQNKKTIDDMFLAASEHLDSSREINLFIDNDFRNAGLAAMVRTI
jgi:hypothetical protein